MRRCWPLMVMVLSLMTGCAWLPKPLPNPLTAEQEQRVAADFVAALAQLPEFDPVHTTVQVPTAPTPFGARLEEQLRISGFGLQLIDDQASSDNTVTTDTYVFTTDETVLLSYRVRVGKAELSRGYRLQGARVLPVSGMSVRGPSAEGIALDPSIFDRQISVDPVARNVDDASTTPSPKTAVTSANPTASRQVQTHGDSIANTGNAIDDSTSDMRTTPISAEQNPMAESQVYKSQQLNRPEALRWQSVLGIEPGAQPAADDSQSGQGTSLLSVPEPGRPVSRRNIVDLGQSNFTDVFDGTEIVRQSVIAFPNDSLRLGQTNKALLYQWAQAFKAESDLFSVIGCSNGATNLANGNEWLATGRANRVKESLILAGIPAEHILEEGCWASTWQEPFPRRGVVVTHRRRMKG